METYSVHLNGQYTAVIRTWDGDVYDDREIDETLGEGLSYEEACKVMAENRRRQYFGPSYGEGFAQLSVLDGNRRTVAVFDNGVVEVGPG